MGEPWSSADLRAQAEAISGKTVGQNWHRNFEKRHPELRAAKPAKFDPKRTKHFNETVISDFYDKWEDLNTKHNGIPPEHMWNWAPIAEIGVPFARPKRLANISPACCCTRP